MPRMPRPVTSKTIHGTGTKNDPYRLVLTTIPPEIQHDPEHVATLSIDGAGDYWLIAAKTAVADSLAVNLRKALFFQNSSLSQRGGAPTKLKISQSIFEGEACVVGLDPNSGKFLLRLLNQKAEPQDAALSHESLRLLHDAIYAILSEQKQIESGPRN